MITWLRRIIFLLALLCAWQFTAVLRFWPEYVFPSPESVLSSLWAGIHDGQFLLGALASLRRLVLGYSLSVAIGLLLGLSLTLSRVLDETVGMVLLGLQTLPSICWLPLAVLWFGLSDRAVVFVIVMGSMLSIALSTRTAVRQVPRLLVNAGRTLGASGFTLVLRVIVPAALPALVEGMKQGWSFAWRSLMAGELIFVTVGLGHLLNMGRELNDISRVFAVMLLIISIGLIVDQLVFSLIESRIAAIWGYRKNSDP